MARGRTLAPSCPSRLGLTEECSGHVPSDLQCADLFDARLATSMPRRTRSTRPSLLGDRAASSCLARGMRSAARRVRSLGGLGRLSSVLESTQERNVVCESRTLGPAARRATTRRRRDVAFSPFNRSRRLSCGHSKASSALTGAGATTLGPRTALDHCRLHALLGPAGPSPARRHHRRRRRTRHGRRSRRVRTMRGLPQSRRSASCSTTCCGRTTRSACLRRTARSSVHLRRRTS